MTFTSKSTACSFLRVIVSIIISLSVFRASVTGLTRVSMTTLHVVQKNFPYTTHCDKAIEQVACQNFCGPEGSCRQIRIDESISYSFCNCKKKPAIEESGYSCSHRKTTTGKCPYVCGGSGSSPYKCQFEDLKKKPSTVKSYCVCVNPNSY